MMQLKFNISDIVDNTSSHRSKRGSTFLYISDGNSRTAYLKLSEDDAATVRGICGENVKFMFLEGERAAIITGGGSRRVTKRDSSGSENLKQCKISVSDRSLRGRLAGVLGTGSTAAILEPAKLADGTLCVYVQFDDGRDAR